MREWLYYNFAAKSFHTKKLCSRLYSIETEYYLKNKKSLFEPPFGGLRDNVRTPSIARWKACGWLPVSHNWTFLRYLLRLRRYKPQSVEVGVFRREVGHFEHKFQTEGGVAYQPLLVSENYRVTCPFVWYKNIHSAMFVFVTKHACDRQTDRLTDRQADGQNYDSQAELA